MAAQIIAVIIFVAMFVLLVTEKIERHIVTMACGILTVIGVFIICMKDWNTAWEVISLESFIQPHFWYTTGESTTSVGINWETICFIVGMMVMVEGMAASGFFRWLCMAIAKAVNYRPAPIFVIFMLLSAVLSMFIDSITVIMFLAAVTAELARLLKISPVPMILAEVFCANLGGAATMCGDPPNIIIGTSLGYSFADFISNTGIIVLISLVVIVPYFYLILGRRLKAGSGVDISAFPAPSSAIVNKRDFVLSCLIFLLAVVLLVSHAATGLTVSTIGIFIALLTLVCAGKNALELLKKVARLVRAQNYELGNADCTIIAQRPKLAPYIDPMRENISRALGVDIARISVKATTEEHLGFTGEGLGIAAHAVVLLEEIR